VVRVRQIWARPGRAGLGWATHPHSMHCFAGEIADSGCIYVYLVDWWVVLCGCSVGAMRSGCRCTSHSGAGWVRRWCGVGAGTIAIAVQCGVSAMHCGSGWAELG
jgi:hypothetical protein